VAWLRGFGVLLLLALGLCGALFAQPLQAVPALTARVIDGPGGLPQERRNALEARLAAFEAERGTQIAVLLVRSTAPENIGSYAQRVGDAWKLGRAGVGDGLLIVVAVDDRRIWIATSKALEGAVPDLAARQIIRERITPAFRQGDLAGGLEAGVEALMTRIGAEGLPAPAPPTPIEQLGGDWGSQLEQAALFFFVAVPVISMVFTGIFGRRLGALLTGGASGGLAWLFTGSLGLAIAAGVVALVIVGVLGVGALLQRAGSATRRHRGRAGPVVWGGGTGGWNGGGWSGGGDGGGFGGGGFSSGGGGDFGGGGAGGDW
jgi:uncharacterized protein